MRYKFLFITFTALYVILLSIPFHGPLSRINVPRLGARTVANLFNAEFSFIWRFIIVRKLHLLPVHQSFISIVDHQCHNRQSLNFLIFLAFFFRFYHSWNVLLSESFLPKASPIFLLGKQVTRGHCLLERRLQYNSLLFLLHILFPNYLNLYGRLVE